jgi:hypothetical protein
MRTSSATMVKTQLPLTPRLAQFQLRHGRMEITTTPQQQNQ